MKEKEHKMTSGDSNQYKRLVTSAPYVPGDSSPLVSIQDIPWVDQSLVKHGLSFYATHLTQAIFGSTLTLLVALSVKPNTSATIKGRLGEPTKHFSRFISTLKFSFDFFFFNFDPARANKSYAYVRKRHNLASKTFTRPSNKPIQPREDDLFIEDWKKDVSVAVAADLEHIDTSSAPKHLLTWKPALAVSQLDMVVNQLISIWMFWGFPKLFGIKDREQELKGLIHLWAIHGRMLGIQDEYNICIKPDPQLYDLLTRNFLIESLKTMDETIITVQHTLIECLRVRIPFMTYKAMLYIGLHEIQGHEGKNLWKIMTVWDKASFRFIQGWLWLARQGFVFQIFVDIPTVIWLMYHLRSYIFSTIYGLLSFMTKFVVGKVYSVLNMTPWNLQKI